jgi:hypothetical protein
MYSLLIWPSQQKKLGSPIAFLHSQSLPCSMLLAPYSSFLWWLTLSFQLHFQLANHALVYLSHRSWVESHMLLGKWARSYLQ